MNKNLNLFYLIIFVALLLPVISAAQTPLISPPLNERHTGFIGATATITMTRKQWEDMLLDSLRWEEQKPLVKFYNGKKIKSIRWQKSTGRVVVDFYGKDNVVIKKPEAVKAGLFKPGNEFEPIKTDPYVPLKPVDIFIDSPLYIGINNEVRLYGPVISDIIMPQNRVHVTSTGTGNNYTATASIPGKTEFVFIDSITGKIKYICHAIVKRLPGDGPETEPEVRLGNIITATTDTAFLKRQNEIVITNGFSLAGGTVYFTGTGFKDIIVVDLDKGITFIKPYLDLCMPGSQITFDDITVRDASGKIYSANGFLITVTDNSFPADSVVDYYSLSVFPQFLWGEGSLESYVRENIAAGAAKGIAVSGQRVALILKIETDGSVSPVSDSELAAFTTLERKCFDIIKKGPAWSPGSFKGVNTAMTVTFYCEF